MYIVKYKHLSFVSRVYVVTANNTIWTVNSIFTILRPVVVTVIDTLGKAIYVVVLCNDTNTPPQGECVTLVLRIY